MAQSALHVGSAGHGALCRPLRGAPAHRNGRRRDQRRRTRTPRRHGPGTRRRRGRRDDAPRLACRRRVSLRERETRRRPLASMQRSDPPDCRPPTCRVPWRTRIRGSAVRPGTRLLLPLLAALWVAAWVGGALPTIAHAQPAPGAARAAPEMPLLQPAATVTKTLAATEAGCATSTLDDARSPRRHDRLLLLFHHQHRRRSFGAQQPAGRHGPGPPGLVSRPYGRQHCRGRYPPPRVRGRGHPGSDVTRHSDPVPARQHQRVHTPQSHDTTVDVVAPQTALVLTVGTTNTPCATTGRGDRGVQHADLLLPDPKQYG